MSGNVYCVRVKTHEGMRHHGEISGYAFIRIIGWNAVRHSDHCFCLNVQAMPKIRKFGVRYLQFRLVKAKEFCVYNLPLSLLSECRRVVNEYGEENYRIPIGMCSLKRRVPIGETDPKKQKKPEPPKNPTLF